MTAAEKERIKDLKIELKARKLVLAKLETALKPLQAKAERQRTDRAVRREVILGEYKTYDEAHEAYGYGYITEKDFEEIVDFLENSQKKVDAPDAEAIAASIIKDWIKRMNSDIYHFEFELKPPEEQEEIRRKNEEFHQAQAERRKRQGRI